MVNRNKALCCGHYRKPVFKNWNSALTFRIMSFVKNIFFPFRERLTEYFFSKSFSRGNAFVLVLVELGGQEF